MQKSGILYLFHRPDFDLKSLWRFQRGAISSKVCLLSLLASFIKSTSILACETNLSKKGAHFWFCSSTIGGFSSIYYLTSLLKSVSQKREVSTTFAMTTIFGLWSKSLYLSPAVSYVSIFQQ